MLDWKVSIPLLFVSYSSYTLCPVPLSRRQAMRAWRANLSVVTYEPN
jgi:hypothetical protein